MREYRRSSSYHRSGHKTSTSKDKNHDREREKDRDLYRSRERTNRDERHSRDHHNYDADIKRRRIERTSHDREDRSLSSRDKRIIWDHDRNCSSDERNYYYYNDKRRKSKLRASKHTKKSRHRQLSTSSSSSSSSLSSLNSRDSYSSQFSEQLRRRRSKTRESSVDGKPLGSKTLSNAIIAKELDILDNQVQKALEIINEDTFVQAVFCKTKDREAPIPQRLSLPQEIIVKGDKVIIDLNAETVTFPKHTETSTNIPNNDKNEIFHPNFLGDAEQKQEKWIRKLFLYRQKYMKQ